MSEKVPMKGWKTKWGAIILLAGQTVTGAADIAPDPTAAEWIRFAGKILTGIGTGLTAWGIGHKIEKAGEEPVYLKPSVTKE